jgi:hypothetical protein
METVTMVNLCIEPQIMMHGLTEMADSKFV